MKRFLTGCGLLLVTGIAAGQVVECFDAKGNKSIAQFCPPGTVRENKVMKGGAGPGPATAGKSATGEKSLAERDADFKKRTLDRQEAEKKGAKEEAEAKETERNCLDARAQLRGLQDGQRISRTDPKTGERVVLEDKDRPGEIAGAQKSVDQWCNKK
ncbi:MAG: hypothetical protein JWN94_2130 [Betaproteobacteria bacterium]|nr:hypothetical protein [Betaproteobacteria bacterium]